MPCRAPRLHLDVRKEDDECGDSVAKRRIKRVVVETRVANRKARELPHVHILISAAGNERGDETVPAEVFVPSLPYGSQD